MIRLAARTLPLIAAVILAVVLFQAFLYARVTTPASMLDGMWCYIAAWFTTWRHQNSWGGVRYMTQTRERVFCRKKRG